jgi:hypothetical protein
MEATPLNWTYFWSTSNALLRQCSRLCHRKQFFWLGPKRHQIRMARSATPLVQTLLSTTKNK